jgi:hypothetical protein
MPTTRSLRILVATAATALLLVAPATADAPLQPVVKVQASISPSKVKKGTAVALSVNTFFDTNPPGGDSAPVTQGLALFPKGAVTNGRLFPSCSAAQLTRAHNVLSKCPKGSLIGKGTVLAKAVQLNVISTGKVTLFNGPGGRSVTFNIHATIPADINQSFDAPLKRIGGKYSYSLTLPVPESLQQILPGVFVSVRNFKIHTNASIVSHGKRRGYIEVNQCPKGGKAPIHVAVKFADGTSAATDSTIAYKCA